MQNQFYTSEIFIYPIKSLGSVACDSIILSPTGLKDDRRWMLVNSKGKMITQREKPQLNLIQCKKNMDDYSIILPNGESALLQSIDPVGKNIGVDIWKTKVTAYDTQFEVAQLLSAYLDEEIKIVGMQKNGRIKNNTFTNEPHPLNFQDGYQIHIINKKSVEALAVQSKVSINTSQFRPNIIIELDEAYVEDELTNFTINDIQFENIKPCERCVMITILPNTAKINKEPLSSLAKIKRSANTVNFGIYVKVNGNI